jgi:hypothetical protein
MSKKKAPEEGKQKESTPSLDFDAMRQFLKDMDDEIGGAGLSVMGDDRHREWFNRHDELLHGGQHHGVRKVKLRQLYNDVRDKLEEHGEKTQ